jgi:hypothetical protein
MGWSPPLGGVLMFVELHQHFHCRHSLRGYEEGSPSIRSMDKLRAFEATTQSESSGHS